jgi:putative ATPase
MATHAPLAERMRPKSLNDYVGQSHLLKQGAVLQRVIENGHLPSLLLWGPPGVGKTSLAHLIALQLKRPMTTLSAIHSGVKDVREAIAQAKSQRFFNSPKPILFIDEIHRFSKSQQDSLLGAVEMGEITLIGATTENPSFEVIPALISRCQVYTLQALTVPELEFILNNAITQDYDYKALDIELKETSALLKISGGDARKLLNALELVVDSQTQVAAQKITITDELVMTCIQQNLALYDKNGEAHYDIISAFIKSIRGSDPNAAVYWLARMIEGGEDALFIARRLVILAAEDIGLANPNALLLANACFDAVHKIGMPEGRIPLSQLSVYLATSAKSNSTYLAIDEALAFIRQQGGAPVPLHLRNAPTKLMKDLNYGKDYAYSHNHQGNFVIQNYLPEALDGHKFFTPQNNPQEQLIADRLAYWWQGKYGYKKE